MTPVMGSAAGYPATPRMDPVRRGEAARSRVELRVGLDHRVTTSLAELRAGLDDIPGGAPSRLAWVELRSLAEALVAPTLRPVTATPAIPGLLPSL